ncbi:NAD-dependent epimerase/dehydratase family protein [Acidithiobacillus sp.]|uniref:NAD-dependent epimerase/dehydratase family protein n=1 Tax=Acidithiobacillus sp. TaxID=1872118 RepID=UPI0025BC8B52|nr:NAD-dependent epimerase/dehydratase family protein [Acidithiobacillus sp.]MCK9189685.1 NAD-dependent epimerase/dehydratase family protein [Acidithiobacillus sp.]MCK9359495.1 NAD-dependent epimerase/dehydratase family protein [Acidithiobacillus sp.]
MRICILGGDGYLGWPTAMHFSARGHKVLAVDNMIKRHWEAVVDVAPLEPTPLLQGRAVHWHGKTGKVIEVVVGDIATDPELLQRICRDYQPDVIIHYAEQPSAPYSMMNQNAAIHTQQNNIIGTLNVMFAMHDHCPQAHLIKLGTMGEYGTPNIDIEEGWIEIGHKGRKDRMLYPKKAHSLYHLSKVADSNNLEFACRVWNLAVTDLNQGVVYGIDTPEMDNDPDLRTSFYYDDIFGTVLNRFVVQAAIGHPLTIYGNGGQTRGYLNIQDTLQCVELAALHPAKAGEFRVFNQFTEQFSIMDIAGKIQKVSGTRDLDVAINHLPNPREEMEQHYYHAIHTGLPELGLKPHMLTDDVIAHMLDRAISAKDNVRRVGLLPRVTWKHGMDDKQIIQASRE